MEKLRGYKKEPSENKIVIFDEFLENHIEVVLSLNFFLEVSRPIKEFLLYFEMGEDGFASCEQGGFLLE